MRNWRVALTLLAAVAAAAAGAHALERNEVDPMHKWDLTALYATLDDFTAAKEEVAADLGKLSAYEGKVGKSAGNLAAVLDLTWDLERRMRRLESYAGRLADQDTRVSDNKALESQIENLRTRLSKESAFIDPEIVAMGEKKLERFLAREEALGPYAFPLRETMRKREHVLSPKEEDILAAAGDILYVGYSGYGLLTNADMPFKTIKLSDGSKVKMTYPNFDKVRRSTVEADRVKGFKTFFGQYAQFSRTLADLLYGQLKAYTFYAQTRGYDSTLAYALDRGNIDPQIYHSLIEAAHRNLPTFHRYLKLKARAIGKDHLDYTDMYVPFTDKEGIPVAWEQAKTLLAEAMAPLGDRYVGLVERSFDERWIDVYPTDGKRTGAYSSGWAYDAHPYVLMNYNDTYSNALTLAHELGHAMHSYHSNEAQPIPTASYSTFVAEVASTFNENLLNDQMLREVQSDDEKLFLLGNFLDGTIKGTFFRQIQFAEFELKIHEMVEQGQPLTGDVLSDLYLKLTKKYYGHDEGVVDVPDLIAVEWAAIPHFYYNYYVFQYSTSVSAASLLAQRVIDGKKGALKRYYGMLKAGGSNYPVEILKKAGADMTKPAAYNALMDRANRYMDEIEAILDAKDKKQAKR